MLIEPIDGRARWVKADHVDLFGTRDFEARKDHDSPASNALRNVSSPATLPIGDTDDLDFILDALLHDRGVVIALGETMPSTPILLRVGTWVDLKGTFQKRANISFGRGLVLEWSIRQAYHIEDFGFDRRFDTIGISVFEQVPK